MNKLQNRKNIYITIAILTLVLIGIGYAVLTNNLNIQGNTNVKKNTWDVHFENIKVLSGSIEANSINIVDDTSVNYNIDLKKPGDYFEFTVDVVNEGSFDAMIESFSNTGLTAEQQKYITYTATYSDGLNLENKQELKVGDSDKLRIRLEYKKDLAASDLPSQNSGISLTFTVNYGEAENAVAVNHVICKRATTLHTGICTYTQSAYTCGDPGLGYYNGEVMSYGSLGTIGTLTSGDAFDCDVNGDGEYNSETERFYYLTDLYSNNDYAVLIYYNNVSGGEPNSRAPYAYDASGTPRTNGPITAVQQLPTLQQWSNVRLSNVNRGIYSQLEYGVNFSPNDYYLMFSYVGYSARLLTVDEIYKACNNDPGVMNSINTCLFLLENTVFDHMGLEAYWLENQATYYENHAMHIYATFRQANNEIATNNTRNGVRPVIEVEKSKINY